MFEHDESVTADRMLVRALEGQDRVTYLMHLQFEPQCGSAPEREL